MNVYFIIDFDSTLVTKEGLEVLADIALEKNPKKDEILQKIKEICKLGMEGKIGFDESLSRRMKLLKADKKDIDKAVAVLKKAITPSFKRNIKFIKTYADKIYIISGGFREWILPVVKPFGIDQSHILANTFVFDKKGSIIGYDKKNILSEKGGKALAVAALHLKGMIWVVGDGHTDFEVKKEGYANKFIAFTENVYREPVVKNADEVYYNFDELLYFHHFPMSVSFPKNRIKVLLLENISNIAIEKFEKEGYKVEWYEKSLPEEELTSKVKNIHIIGLRSRTQLTKKVLENSPHLISAGAFCIGTDQIDLDAASVSGVVVFNAPYSNTRSVVELVLGEIIMLSRGTFDKSQKLHSGIWDKSAKNSNEIRGKTLGIIGYGNIGSQLSVVAEGMGMNVIYYDVVEKLSLGNAQRVSLKKLLKESDIVTVHVDGRKENEGLIGEKEFQKMKNGVVFLNLSRGKIVDIQALSRNILNKKIRGAGVDVFPKEPKSKEEKFISPLQDLPNVILTPHIGGSTAEAQDSIGHFVADKITEYINTGQTYLSVNVPNIQLPKLKNAHRMLHLHKNIPGVLANINQIFSENKINIVGQYLKTNEQIGYVITDVNKKYDNKVINCLKDVEGTIKLRVLY